MEGGVVVGKPVGGEMGDSCENILKAKKRQQKIDAINSKTKIVSESESRICAEEQKYNNQRIKEEVNKGKFVSIRR